MKKLIGVLCTVTILSACSNDSELKAKAMANRRGPQLNNSGMAVPPAPAMLATDSSIPPSVLMKRPDDTGYMPLPPAKPLNTTSNYTAPPLGGMTELSARPSLAVASNSAPSSASGRRAPELNRDALGQSTPSGDLLAPVAPVSVTSTPSISSAPLNIASAEMPSGGSIVPPPPPVAMSAPVAPMAPQRSDDYPKLAQIPPAPPAPQPAMADPRVQDMKQELASMNEEQSRIQGGPSRVVVKSVSNGSATSPSISATTMPVPPAAPVIPQPPAFPPAPASNVENPGELRMPPAFANKQQPQQSQQMAAMTPPSEFSPVPPAPPAQLAPVQPVAPAPVSLAAAPAPLAQVPQAPQPPAFLPPSSPMPSPGLMPMGPTVVVRSNKSAPRPLQEQEFASVPPAPQMQQPPAILPPVAPQAPVYAAPQPPVYYSPQAPLPPAPPPAPLAQLTPPPSVLPPVPPAGYMGNEPVNASPAPQVASRTLHTSLRPIPAEPVGQASSQDDEYAVAPSQTSTRASDLRPIANQHYQSLPDSRYARARQAARAGYDQN